MVRPAFRRLSATLAALAASLIAASAAAQAPSSHAALGAQTCGDASCHDAAKPWPNSAVSQREFAVWRERDPHAGAYRTLETPAARRIAATAGAGRPTESRVCLSCHALNLPAERREATFDIAEGVGCESCHGPASGWLGVHSSGLRFYGDNLSAGMYPTTDPAARAELCLSCHVGKGTAVVSHAMIAGGHPAPPFELSFYSWFARGAPGERAGYAHFTVDDDYLQRKPWPFGVRVWAVGQAAQAAALLDLVAREARRDTLFPEPALFECRTCHREATAAGGAGAALPRFKAANLVLVEIAAGLVDPGLARKVRGGAGALEAAAGESWDAVIAASAALRGTLGAVQAAFERHDFTEADARRALVALDAAARAGRFGDYEAAEQAVLAAASLSDELIRLDAFAGPNAAAAEDAVTRGFGAFRNPDSHSGRDVRAALAELARLAGRQE